jgi:hypothetical protein
VKVFAALYGLADAAGRARELRDAGATGVATFEGPHDVFAPLTLAATVPGLDLLTNVAIAFPRNPIHLAHQANDHQLLSSGRFFLGLGTQIRTQIEKRFGAQFDRPVARIAACGTPPEIAAHIRDRVDGVADTVCLYQPAAVGTHTLAAIIDQLAH